MNLDEFRKQMDSYRGCADVEAKSLKYPQLALDRLCSLYLTLDVYERTMADQVLAEWVVSEDENVRFDALALVDDLKIQAATSALRRLVARLSSSDAPGATYELRKVDRILQSLGSHTRGV